MQTRLPLNNLNAFAAAAEHMSFQQAAERLFVSPSAVSHQVRNLESILGYKLFERVDKGVRLTHQGERLFNDISGPIKQLHEASLKALRGREKNTLALSVAPAFATGWLLPRIHDFYSAHSEINLSVVATTQVIDFQSDPFDASIRMGKGEWAQTVSQPLFGREIIAVCSPSLLAQYGGFIPADTLTTLPLIHNNSMPNLWGEWFKSISVSGFTEKGIIQVQDSAQVVGAIQSGDAVGLVDKNLFPQDLASGRLVQANDHVLRGGDGYYLVYPESMDTLPSLHAFRDWLRQQLAITSALT